MPFQIVVDSCCDLTPEMRGSGLYHNVPLTIYVGESAFRDDMALDTQDLVDAMAMCQEASHTACPAPADYLSMFERCDGDLYVVTLSALLSGSHNSAWQASRLFLEEHPERNIHVFNSCSASSGEVLVALKVRELAESGAPFKHVVREVEQFIYQMQTMFVLETLENLRKNGRLTRLQSVITGALKIKLLMGATPEGEICKLGQTLSMKQALSKMVDHMANDPAHAGRVLAICHCNCLDRAFQVKAMAEQRCKFAHILILEAGGITSVYANDGGIVTAY